MMRRKQNFLCDSILEISFLINQVSCNMVVPISDLHENDNVTKVAKREA